MTVTDELISKVSYIAGLIDGEGSLYITKDKHKKFSAGIKIAMNDKQGLLIVQSVFGGRIYKGSKKFCLIKQKEYAPAWVLQYRSKEKIKEILFYIKPFLQVKKEQAAVLEEFLGFNSDSKFRTSAQKNNLYIKCRALKSRYWNKL